MNSTIFRQVWYEFRHQPVSSIVTVIGTALSIFLIMVLITTTSVEIRPFGPENHRDRYLHGKFMHSRGEDGEKSSGMSLSAAKLLYDSLATAPLVTFYREAQDLEIPVSETAFDRFTIRSVDDNFFKVFNFDFIFGKPFSPDAVKSGLKEAILTESVARKVFGTTEVMGKEIKINDAAYRVVGIIEDVSPLATSVYAQIYKISELKTGPITESEHLYGDVCTTILAESPDDFDDIRREVEERKQHLIRVMKEFDYELIDHGQPFDQAEKVYLGGSNEGSNYKENLMSQIIIISILLLVPAINLSSMTQGRLRRRISEIGVRRAFGATRWSIICEIILENFIVTLAGGLIGLILSIIFSLLFSSMLFTGWGNIEVEHVALTSLINFRIFGWALLMCFVLNILSSGVPAWRASRTNPVDAIKSV